MNPLMTKRPTARFEPTNYIDLRMTLNWDIAARVKKPGEPARDSTHSSRAFGRTVKRLREEKDQSVFDLASAAGMSVRKLAIIEAGIAVPREITPAVFEHLALALGGDRMPAVELLRYRPEGFFRSIWAEFRVKWGDFFSGASLPLAVAKPMAASGLAARTLDGGPPGMRLQLRWPRPGTRSSVQIAIIIDDWTQLELDPDRPIELGLQWAAPAPTSVPWEDWVHDGTWMKAVYRPRAAVIVPLTRPGIELSQRQVAILQRTIDAGLRLLPPRHLP